MTLPNNYAATKLSPRSSKMRLSQAISAWLRERSTSQRVHARCRHKYGKTHRPGPRSAIVCRCVTSRACPSIKQLGIKGKTVEDLYSMKMSGRHTNVCKCPVCNHFGGEHANTCKCPHCGQFGGAHTNICKCPGCGHFGGTHTNTCKCPQCGQFG
jgi:hypothetical protein